MDPLEDADGAFGLAEAAERDVAGLQAELGDAQEGGEHAEVAGELLRRLGVDERVEKGETAVRGGERANMTMESSMDFLLSARRSRSSASDVRFPTSEGHSSSIWFST